MIFYHIHKISDDDEIEKLWRVGNIIKFNNNKYNNFFSFSNSYKPLFPYNNKLIPINNITDFCINNSRVFEYERLLKFSSNCISEYQILLREIAYENIRMAHFEKLPSRLNCIWLCRKNQIDVWKRLINNQNVKIFKINTRNNKVFKTSNKLICLPCDSFQEINNKALQYWSYSNDKDNEDDEYLYVGDIEILEEI